MRDLKDVASLGRKTDVAHLSGCVMRGDAPMAGPLFISVSFVLGRTMSKMLMCFPVGLRGAHHHHRQKHLSGVMRKYLEVVLPSSWSSLKCFFVSEMSG